MIFGCNFHGLQGDLQRQQEMHESESWKYSIKMLLFCASYNYIYNNSEYLKEIIYDKENNYNRSKFYFYDNYDVKVENETIMIYEKETNDVVWKIPLWKKSSDEESKDE